MDGIPDNRLVQMASCNVICCCPVNFLRDPPEAENANSGVLVRVRPAPGSEDASGSCSGMPEQSSEDALWSNVVLKQGGRSESSSAGALADDCAAGGAPPPPPPELNAIEDTSSKQLPAAPIDDPLRSLLNRWCDTSEAPISGSASLAKQMGGASASSSPAKQWNGTPAEAPQLALPDTDYYAETGGLKTPGQRSQGSTTPLHGVATIRVQAPGQRGTTTPQASPSAWQTGRIGETPQTSPLGSNVNTLQREPSLRTAGRSFLQSQGQACVDESEPLPHSRGSSSRSIPPPPESPVGSTPAGHRSAFVFMAPP